MPARSEAEEPASANTNPKGPNRSVLIAVSSAAAETEADEPVR